MIEISNDEKKLLLILARNSIERKFNKENDISFGLLEKLKNIKAGVFVTLRSNGELRGCIGYLTPTRSLPDTIISASVSAGFEDPRFIPLQIGELNEIEIEISVLTPPLKLLNIEDLVIGKHGIIIQKESKRGLLLPQVAVENKMSVKEFLSAGCKKAGLSKNCSSLTDTDIYIFEAEVFSENDFND